MVKEGKTKSKAQAEDTVDDMVVESTKKKEKKRKSADETEPKKPKKTKLENGAVANGTATHSDEAAPEVGSPSKKTKKKKAEVESVVAAETKAVVEVDPNAIDNFRLSAPTKAILRAKGILSLFPIQAQTLHIALDGNDVVGRARTGCGKTLAFVLPIIEALLAKPPADLGKRGAVPSVITLLPTRELANQVHEDFELMGKAARLRTVCVYGGANFDGQRSKLYGGVEVVVGTPGRVKDLLERKDLKMGSLRFRVLDECDRMLDMGFVDDVETILAAGPADPAAVQTLLFSATMPNWVRDITKRFLKPNFIQVDLVGNEKMKASTSVQHLMLPCHWTDRDALVMDLVKCYGASGTSIIFTQTKKDASELASTLSSTGKLNSCALHGDIPQKAREVALAGFKSGKYNVLVATDVAARGLDISGVELVVQTEPPQDAEDYIHRAGRTGRANRTGICITMVTQKHEWKVPQIEKAAGMTFKRIGPPQPADMAKTAGERVVESVMAVSRSVVPMFKESAQKLIESVGSAEEAVALCLAVATGFKAVGTRSLMNGANDHVTLLYKHDQQWPLSGTGHVWRAVRAVLPAELCDRVRRMSISKDGLSAVFDVPADDMDSVRAAIKDSLVSEAKELPELQAVPGAGAGGYGGGSGGSGGYRSWGSGGRTPMGQGRGTWGGGRGGRGGRSW